MLIGTDHLEYDAERRAVSLRQQHASDSYALSGNFRTSGVAVLRSIFSALFSGTQSSVTALQTEIDYFHCDAQRRAVPL